MESADIMLPRYGKGYVGKKGDATRYGTMSTIRFITKLGEAWSELMPEGPRLQIGDISPKGGGPCPNGGRDAKGQPTYHKSHQGGMDFDVQIVRGDGKELYRSVKITDPSTHAPTQRLVQLIETLGGSRIKFIFTAGSDVLRGKHVRREHDHVYHLHVRLR